MNEFQFCPSCGNKSLQQTQHRLKECSNCGLEWYTNPVPAANCILVNSKKEILLGKRNFDPKKGMWGTVGGFVDPNENLEQAVVREIYEEIGLKIDPTRLEYIYSGKDRYPYNQWNYYTVGAVFYAEISDQESQQMQPNDDVSELKFFQADDIPWEEIAFDSAKESLKLTIEKKKLLANNLDLEKLRQEIDNLDSELINLLATRRDLAKLIGEYKRQKKLQIIDPNRWQKVLEKTKAEAKMNSLDEDIITKIWELIHTQSIRVEKNNN